MHFLLSGCFNIISFLDVIMVSTWVHFRLPNPPKSWLGGVKGASRVVWEASWDRLGGVLEPSWGRLGDVLERLGASCGHLGSVLEVSCVWFSGQSRYAILDVIFELIFGGYCSQKSIPDSWKIIKFYWKNRYLLVSGCFNIILFLDVILVSTWIHFRLPNPPKSWLGGL